MHGLADVIEDPSPLFYGRRNRGEVIVGHHHIRRFLGDIRAGESHRHPDVGCLDRGSIVDAVAGHGHNRAPPLPGVHDSELVFGRHAGIDRDPFDELRQLIVAQITQVRSGQSRSVLPIQAQFPRDRHRRLFVIAGNHHGSDPGVPAKPHRLDGFGPQRIFHGKQAEKDQIPFHDIGRKFIRFPIPLSLRHRQHPERLPRQHRVGIEQGLTLGLAERFGVPVGRQPIGTTAQQDIGRSFHIGDQTIPGSANDRHPFPLGVKRDFARKCGVPLGFFLCDSALRRHDQQRPLRRIP